MREAGAIKVWLLALVPTLALSFGILVGVGCLLGANACPFTSEEPFTSTDGAVIWQANCMLCHGTDGRGSERNTVAPSLVEGDAATLSFDALVSEIGSGSPGLMPRFKGHLSPEQIDAVARYVMELRGSDDEEDVDD